MQVTSSRSAQVTLPSDTEILITREFDAPKHLVYRAWTEPELVKKWWNAKRGEVTIAEIDLRVGGKWRWVQVTPEGFEVAFHGEYKEIIPDERLVSTEEYEGAPGAVGLNTMTLVETNGRTKLQIVAAHSSKENRDAVIASGMEDGLQDALDLVEELVATLA